MIRTLHLGDFLKLGRLHEAELGLNLPDSLVVPNSPLSAALTQRLPVHNLASSVYIFEENGKPKAFAQASARRRPEEWNVLALGFVEQSNPAKNGDDLKPVNEAEDAPNLEIPETEADGPEIKNEEANSEIGPEVEPVENKQLEITKAELTQNSEEIEFAWLKLLEHLVVDAGEKGITRVFAKLSAESPELSLFSQTGFHPYTNESLLTLHFEGPLEQPSALKLRPQHKRDPWFIDQLYNSVTPTFVKNSEQTISRDWEIHKSRFPRNIREYGWVLEENEKVVAYVRVTSNRHKHMLRILNLDSQRGQLGDLVRFALATLKPGPECFVYCTVREYQAEQENVLEEAGFTYFGKQALMVKHTVQYVRNPEKVLIHNRDRKLELAPIARPNLLVRLLTKLPFHSILLQRNN